TERGGVWRTGEVVVASAPPPEPGTGDGVHREVVASPSRGTATGTRTLRTPSRVRVALLAALGREVAVLHEGPLGAGRHALALDRAALPVGIYVVHVAAGREVATARVTVVR